MSDKVVDAVVTIDSSKVERKLTEMDHKFLLAMFMVITYAILLFVPIISKDTDMFKIVAATISGPVGSIIGYYFGSKE